MTDRLAISSDPLERRRLWREWISVDAPAAARSSNPGARMPVNVRRATAAYRESTVDMSRSRMRDPDRRDAVPAADWVEQVIDRPDGVVAGLSAAIEASLVGNELPWADRNRLVRRAMKVGLTRFEATLLIAAVQHRAQRDPDRVPAATETAPQRTWHTKPPRRMGVASLLAMALAGEAALIAIAIQMLR